METKRPVQRPRSRGVSICNLLRGGFIPHSLPVFIPFLFCPPPSLLVSILAPPPCLHPCSASLLRLLAPPPLILHFLILPGETLKEQQVPRHLPKPSSSSSSTSRLRDFKETMSNIIHSRPLSSSSSSSLPAAVLSSDITSSNHHPDTNVALCSSSSGKPQDWEADSTSSESKSSSSGGAVTGRYRPAWRPRREALNIDTIFTRERRRQAGYSPLGGPLPDDCGAPASEGAAREQVASVGPGSAWTLPSTSSSFRGSSDLPPPPPPPPRLIQRMESGYESSERNSSSPVSLDLNLGDR